MVKALVRKCTGIVRGIFVARHMMEEHPDTVLVFSKHGIGDTCLVLSYLEAFKREHHYDKVAFIGDERAKEVYPYFSEVCDEFIFMPDVKKRGALQKLYSSDVGMLFRSRYQGMFYAFTTAYVRPDLLYRNPHIDASMLMKMIMRIPLDSKPYKIPKSVRSLPQQIIDKYHLKEHKTVILNPYAGSMESIPEEEFCKLVKKLKEENFCVICNIIPGQSPVKGTEGVFIELSDLLGLLDYCGYCVGLRSGFMDLAGFSEAVCAVIDNISYDYSEMCRMEKMWESHKNVRSFVVDTGGGYYKNLTQDIFDYMMREGQHK